MRWKRALRSSNVEDRRGRRVAAGGGLGLVGIVIVVIISLVLGKNPIEMLGLVADMGGTAPAVESRGTAPDPNDPAIAFVESILGETEDVWTALIGQRYPAPRLIVFSDRVQSACGDDTLQRRSGGEVVPDAFSHGTAEQRVRWFRQGFDKGDPARCDTFGAASL